MLINEFNYVTANGNEITDGLDRHYELLLVSGTIALALPALGYKGDLGFFDEFLESYESDFKGDDFVMKALYANWIIASDPAGALSFLKDKKNTKGFSYAVCALTDLNCKDSLSVIKNLQSSVKNPVTIEVIKESISRLSLQTRAPDWKDRMIHLFGVVTPGERAIGYENDNVFAARAQKAANDPEIGNIYEYEKNLYDVYYNNDINIGIIF